MTVRSWSRCECRWKAVDYSDDYGVETDSVRVPDDCPTHREGSTSWPSFWSASRRWPFSWRRRAA